MKTIEFSIPYPPTVNHLYSTSGVRKWSEKKKKWYYPRHTSNEARKFKNEVAQIIAYECPKVHYGDSLVEVHIIVYPHTDKRKRDHHNGEKALYDAIELSGIINNDKQIVKRSQDIGEPVQGGRWHVTIKPYQPKELKNEKYN